MLLVPPPFLQPQVYLSPHQLHSVLAESIHWPHQKETLGSSVPLHWLAPHLVAH
ncbi:Uncharacterised protein [Vibrio cholerae]|nr:Uncharacterised protein [Vibrio cholerae]